MPFFKKRLYIALIFGFAFAVCLELFALSTSRWGYTVAMPLIPYLKVGVSPSLQLGVTALLTYFLVLKKWSVTKITSA